MECTTTIRAPLGIIALAVARRIEEPSATVIGRHSGGGVKFAAPGLTIQVSSMEYGQTRLTWKGDAANQTAAARLLKQIQDVTERYVAGKGGRAMVYFSPTGDELRRLLHEELGFVTTDADLMRQALAGLAAIETELEGAVAAL